MIIFVEGPDKAGKSSLCAHLSDRFNMKIERILKPKDCDNPYPEFKQRIRDIKVSTVFDRGYQSEFVYAELWRDGCWMSYQDFNRLDAEACMKSSHVFLINCFAPPEVIKKRLIDEKEELLQQSEVERCLELYFDVMRISNLPVINYDSSVQKAEDIVEIIEKMTKLEKKQTK